MVSVRVLSLLFVVALLTVPAATATTGGGAGGHVHDDHIDPGLSPSFAFFPGPDDVASAVRAHADHPWVTLHELGTSGEGRPILLAEITDPDSPVPMEDRVVTFLFTQQHGNEPAGTPAALQLLDDITTGGAIADTLANQILLLLPMANPDGALANQRANAGGTDINRDHITLETPEANLIHQVLNDWNVHVAMDHHEYGGTGLGNPSPVRLYDYDLTTLFPVHGNVATPTRIIAEELMYDGIWPAAEADGYTANEYGEQTVAGQPIEYVAGGPDPGIMRNHLGLHNVAGLLVETRVDAHPNPFHDAARRTAIHTSVMEATLHYVHERAADFIDAKQRSATLYTETPPDHYHEGAMGGPIPGAWAVPIDAGSDDLTTRHGLPAPFPVDGRHIHNQAIPEAAHLAAIFHSDSSRNVFTAEAVDAHVPADTAEPAATETASGPALVGVLALALIALAVARRR